MSGTPSPYRDAELFEPVSGSALRSVDVAVVGGGFYGMRIATLAATLGQSTLVVEREPRFLSRASFTNQARVHGGYHYPRSILTAMRARHHYGRFTREFARAIDGGFQHAYAIARHQTKVGAREFAEFCRRIRAPLTRAPASLARTFDANFVEQVFLAEEVAFDALELADIAMAGAIGAGVELLPETEAIQIEPGADRRLSLTCHTSGETWTLQADWVINATYLALNTMLRRSGLEQIRLIHEITEVALVDMPREMASLGVTVMDGPFWSCIPFPAVRGAHSLTHVRHTPHLHWHSDDASAGLEPDAPQPSLRRASHVDLMRRDAMRFLPSMRSVAHRQSLWEVKTVLPRSANDDGRPILARVHADAPGLVSVLGAKIDSVYDLEEELLPLLRSGQR